MNGLGNDFAIFDARRDDMTVVVESIREIADREHGVGCDQVIIMETSEKADIFMRIYNADGCEVDACGNATRCVASIIAAELDHSQVSVETNAGILQAEVVTDGAVTVDMGEPKFGWDEIPLAEEFQDTRMIELQLGPIDAPVLHSPSVVNVGNPHCIFWVDDVETHDLATLGPFLENHMLFPEQANISLAEVTSRKSIILRVWERGAGITKACGTAACAAAVAAVRKRLTERDVEVKLPGGTLQISWNEQNRIMMSGPAELEYTSRLNIE
jgi:diaminopimelate epimerase